MFVICIEGDLLGRLSFRPHFVLRYTGFCNLKGMLILGITGVNAGGVMRLSNMVNFCRGFATNSEACVVPLPLEGVAPPSQVASQRQKSPRGLQTWSHPC